MRRPTSSPISLSLAVLLLAGVPGCAGASERWHVDPADEVQWIRRDATSQWSARIARDGNGSTLRADAQWLYRGWTGHQLHLGAQAERDLLDAQAGGSRLGASAHDEWQLAPAWRLTFGARGDAAPEADADASLSPRAALAWQWRERLSLRLLDGLVWRDGAQPLAATEATTATERLRATELAMDWRAGDGLRLGASLRRQRHDELGAPAAASGAQPAALQYQSLGPSAAGAGLGADAELAAGPAWRLRTRWSAFEARGGDADGGIQHLAAVQAAAPLPLAGARLGIEGLWLDRRGAGAPAPSQRLVNASLSWTPAGSGWTMAAHAYNLADQPLDEAPVVPESIAREGRRWQLQFAREF